MPSIEQRELPLTYFAMDLVLILCPQGRRDFLCGPHLLLTRLYLPLQIHLPLLALLGVVCADKERLLGGVDLQAVLVLVGNRHAAFPQQDPPVQDILPTRQLLAAVEQYVIEEVEHEASLAPPRESVKGAFPHNVSLAGDQVQRLVGFGLHLRLQSLEVVHALRLIFHLEDRVRIRLEPLGQSVHLLELGVRLARAPDDVKADERTLRQMVKGKREVELERPSDLPHPLIVPLYDRRVLL
mmetsp:Transcript_24675/g.59383  ORF Transcript_24675/g.59383 Transcript_24675/m.59383 type:complete len:240 (+) Transcript_24675:257-976(+)